MRDEELVKDIGLGVTVTEPAMIVGADNALPVASATIMAFGDPVMVTGVVTPHLAAGRMLNVMVINLVVPAESVVSVLISPLSA